MKTLVVYDTKHGSTREVAETVAESMRSKGAEVALLDLRTKGALRASLDAYGAVVLGAPFYMGRWSTRAARFAKERETELAARRFAFFTLGSTPELQVAGARAALPQSLADAGREAVHLGSKLDYPKLGGFEKFIVKAVSGKAESMSNLDLKGAADFGQRLAAAVGASR